VAFLCRPHLLGVEERDPKLLESRASTRLSCVAESFGLSTRQPPEA
jgi:hypothetical protein